MLAIVEHLQSINRSMLNRLRPMALGHVPLQDILSELVHERGRQHPQIAFSFPAGKLLRGYGDSVDLTVYRCVQESLTNAIRHAQASKVAVEIAEADNRARTSEAAGAAELTLTIRDDGRGIDPRPRPASAPVACKSACKRSAAAIRWRARADRAPACASPSPSTTSGHDQRPHHR